MPLPFGDGLGWAAARETEPFGGPPLGIVDERPVAERCGHVTRLLGRRHHDGRSCANASSSKTDCRTGCIGTRSSIVAVSVV